MANSCIFSESGILPSLFTEFEGIVPVVVVVVVVEVVVEEVNKINASWYSSA
jgi:hypothetical protein